MIQLEENQSCIWFKVLHKNGTSIDGTNEEWELPTSTNRGHLNAPGEGVRLTKGGLWFQDVSLRQTTWLVNNPNRVYQLNSGLKIFVAQVTNTPVLEEPGMIWVKDATLLREANNLDLRPFGIFRAFSQTIS